MNFEINTENIPASFDEIAKVLLNKSNLVVNSDIYEITEIEFYYFHKENHPDKYSHPHKRKGGEWRFHSQGLDISLGGLKKEDGGILIRGLKLDGKYINGPKMVLQSIFESFGLVNESSSIVLEELDLAPRKNKIIKTFRHLSGKVRSEEFHLAPYRYLIELDKLDMEDSAKAKILENHTEM